MKTSIILLGTLVVTFIIISPFFWLKFLYRKDRKKYVIYSSIISVMIFFVNTAYIESILLDKFAGINADLYYRYYDINNWTFYVFFFLTLIFPFVVTRIIYEKITFKSFFVSLGFALLIVIIHFLIFAFYVMPRAFESLNRNI